MKNLKVLSAPNAEEEALYIKRWRVNGALQQLSASPQNSLDAILTVASENDKLALQAEPDLLAAVWEMRYGDCWVPTIDIAEDGFMSVLLAQLACTTDWVKSKKLPTPTPEDYMAFGADEAEKPVMVYSSPLAYKVDAPCKS